MCGGGGPKYDVEGMWKSYLTDTYDYGIDRRLDLANTRAKLSSVGVTPGSDLWKSMVNDIEKKYATDVSVLHSGVTTNIMKDFITPRELYPGTEHPEGDWTSGIPADKRHDAIYKQPGFDAVVNKLQQQYNNTRKAVTDAVGKYTDLVNKLTDILGRSPQEWEIRMGVAYGTDFVKSESSYKLTPEQQAQLRAERAAGTADSKKAAAADFIADSEVKSPWL